MNEEGEGMISVSLSIYGERSPLEVKTDCVGEKVFSFTQGFGRLHHHLHCTRSRQVDISHNPTCFIRENYSHTRQRHATYTTLQPAMSIVNPWATT